MSIEDYFAALEDADAVKHATRALRIVKKLQACKVSSAMTPVEMVEHLKQTGMFECVGDPLGISVDRPYGFIQCRASGLLRLTVTYMNGTWEVCTVIHYDEDEFELELPSDIDYSFSVPDVLYSVVETRMGKVELLGYNLTIDEAEDMVCEMVIGKIIRQYSRIVLPEEV